MEPVVLKLLQQEPVDQSEWQNLFYDVHAICLWDEKGPAKIFDCLQQDIVAFIKQAQHRVLAERDEQALLKAYIVEWRKFFTQSNYLPLPFRHLENSLQGKSTTSNRNNNNTSSNNNNNNSTNNNNNNNNNTTSTTSSGSGGPKKGQGSDESIVRKLMLDSWNQSIFCNIKHRLQESAMKLVHSERNGDAFDSQLVIGVRESYVNLCSNTEDKLEIYRENFEAAYLQVIIKSFCFLSFNLMTEVQSILTL